jgi:hypothetical protein
VNLHVAVLPLASVAVAVTVVTPFGNVEPEGGEATTLTPGQLSVAAILYAATAVHAFGAVGIEIFAGQVICGGWVSLTVTLNEQLDELPLASLTEHETVVVPFGKAVPDGGVQTGEPTPGQLSLTVGAA